MEIIQQDNNMAKKAIRIAAEESDPASKVDLDFDTKEVCKPSMLFRPSEARHPSNPVRRRTVSTTATRATAKPNVDTAAYLDTCKRNAANERLPGPAWLVPKSKPYMPLLAVVNQHSSLPPPPRYLN